MHAFDLTALRLIHVQWASPWLDPVFLAFSVLGLGGVQAALCLGFARREGTRHYAFPLIVAIVVAGLPLAQLAKRLIPRDRPSNLWFVVPHEEFKANSFPSGHTSTSFAVAVTVILLRGSAAGWPERLGWLLLASLVGISRVYRGVHWPTDVLAGACCGVVAACVVQAWGITDPEHPVHKRLNETLTNLRQNLMR
ncbi:MAG: phosphatase PAP2 family protein [Fimbriimonadaceae bacterium]|nr:phosphatase PAP2 family protein [Fimbriimonadaceae bacterium]